MALDFGTHRGGRNWELKSSSVLFMSKKKKKNLKEMRKERYMAQTPEEGRRVSALRFKGYNLTAT